MNTVLKGLAQKCREILGDRPGPDGREKIAELLQVLLSDPANVDALVPESTGERDMLYRDPELGFCILAHKYNGEKHRHRMTMDHHGPFMLRPAVRQSCVIMT